LGRFRRYCRLEVVMEKQQVLSTTEARQGKPVGAMRWVLGFGMAGAIIGLIIAGVWTGYLA
jgi:hypothetical protein